MTIFKDEEDFGAFEEVLRQAHQPVNRDNSASGRGHTSRCQWLTAAELEALRRSVQRGCPFGDESWSAQAVRRLGLEATLRPRGRPKKEIKGS